MNRLLLGWAFVAFLCGSCTDKNRVSVDNDIVKLEFDLQKGTYKGIDMATGQTCIYDASWRVDDYTSTDADSIYYQIEAIRDSLGKGQSIQIVSVKKGQPDLVFNFNLYDKEPFVVMYGGVRNQTSSDVQIKEISPVVNARLFQGIDISKNFRLIDGEGGGCPTYVRETPSLLSQNNMILHFGTDDDFHSLVAGGVSYSEFAKYALMGEKERRKADLENHPLDGLRLVSYMDLGEDAVDADTVLPYATFSAVAPYKFEGNVAYKEARTVVWADKEIGVKLHNLKKDKSYVVGLSWCDDADRRRQTVSLKYGNEEIACIENCRLPSLKNNEDAEIVYFEIPAAANVQEPQLLVKQAGGDNVIISEVVIYEGKLSADCLNIPQKVEIPEADFEECTFNLYASDVVGKRVDAKSGYIAENDRFYLDFITRNPVYSAEKYAQTLRTLQQIKLNYYYFPTICMWYAMMPIYGGNIVMGTNDTVGAVEEMERVKSSGFLKYTTMGIRLVPDCYDENNENGWWDDEHWRLHGSGPQGEGMKLKSGHYRSPYDTSKKWAQAILDLGGLPFTYFQTAVRSKDYAEAYPEHMLFNESFHEIDTFDWLNKNYTTYDFTDEGFVAHMRDVYRNLHDAGITGMMFDYPYTGWQVYGGMDDKYSTAASAYRTIFKLASEGLGDEAYIHERNLKYGSDIALGYVASQRTWGDTDVITPEMVTRSGLRWYKNRVVVNYDMDAKNLLKAQPSDSEDGVNKLLTMSYVTASRLLLANSFGTLDSAHVYKLSRIYPFHQFARSARPLDAFTADYPRVYGMKLTDKWSSLTFFNEDEEHSQKIAVRLSGIEGRGGAGLQADKRYYVYDFWNDRLIGIFKGSDVLEQELRKGEARQMAVREMESNPQVLSTDRHLLQGLLELSEVSWNEETKELAGYAELVAGEPMRIAIASNGWNPQSCSVSDAEVKCSSEKNSEDIVKLSLESARGGKVFWKFSFKK